MNKFQKYTVTIDSNKTVRWYKYKTNKLHREDGPAVERADGSKYWFLNDKLHREDGPAVEWASGDKAWYLNGEEYFQEGYQQELDKRKSQAKSTCDGKVVEIEGKKYKLMEVK